jgi:hypothetical protein
MSKIIVKPVKVVIDIDGILYRDIINIKKSKFCSYSIVLPKYNGKQYYSKGYYKRIYGGKWEDLPQFEKY